MYPLVRRVGFTGSSTQTAGTVITATFAPKVRLYTRLMAFSYTAAGTAHTLTVMKSLGRTTLTAAMADNATVANVAANAQTGSAGGAFAANDYIVIELADGTYYTGTCASIATLAITLNAGIGSGKTAASGAKVWMFGVIGDGHLQITLPASVTTSHDPEYGLAGSDGRDEPIIIHSGNATNAGTLLRACVAYTDEGTR